MFFVCLFLVEGILEECSQISPTTFSDFQGEAGLPGPQGLPGLRGEKGDQVSNFKP